MRCGDRSSPLGRDTRPEKGVRGPHAAPGSKRGGKGSTIRNYDKGQSGCKSRAICISRPQVGLLSDLTENRLQVRCDRLLKVGNRTGAMTALPGSLRVRAFLFVPVSHVSRPVLTPNLQVLHVRNTVRNYIFRLVLDPGDSHECHA